MRRFALRLFMLLPVCVATACASQPVCSAEVDISGRGIPVCPAGNARAVCDDPGVMARYDRGASGTLVLVDGTLARCDASNEVVCTDPDTLPYCLTQPSTD